MNNAELYQKSNSLQKSDAREYLEEYAKVIKWNNNGASVIDIGCGDGGVTTSILKSFIPTNFKELVGCDISEQMIKYANANHATDRIRFTVLDIASHLPEIFREKFDHAFSSYALQWIKNQEIAFSNIYDLLASGGDCLLLLMGRLPFYDVYRELGRIPRWSCWLKDVERFVSPYHDSQDPAEDIRKMMTSIRFTNVQVKCLEKIFVYPCKEDFRNAVTATLPFKIPLEMQEDFFKDYVKIVKNMQLIDYGTNGDQFNVKFMYKVIIAYGQK